MFSEGESGARAVADVWAGARVEGEHEVGLTAGIGAVLSVACGEVLLGYVVWACWLGAGVGRAGTLGHAREGEGVGESGPCGGVGRKRARR